MALLEDLEKHSTPPGTCVNNNAVRSICTTESLSGSMMLKPCAQRQDKRAKSGLVCFVHLLERNQLDQQTGSKHTP